MENLQDVGRPSVRFNLSTTVDMIPEAREGDQEVSLVSYLLIVCSADHDLLYNRLIIQRRIPDKAHKF